MSRKSNIGTTRGSGTVNGETAVTYYRFSCHKQGEQSIEGQAEAAQRWARENGYTIIREYADRATTGTNDDREQFQLMLRELEKLRPAVLILWKVDRMGRNKEEIAFNKYRCKKVGTKIVYTAEHIPDTPEGVILESVLEGMAEYYSLQLSQNIRRGQLVNARKGQSIGGNRPLGYRTGPDKHLVIDEEEAALVRVIFERYAAGETQKEIVDGLNAQGLRTKRGRPFTHNSLRTVLKNEKYIGVYTFKDEIRIEGGVPAIVDLETFEKVQRMLKINRRAPAHKWALENYMLSGKLFCGRCGQTMVGKSGNNGRGVKYCYYMCSGKNQTKTATNPGCRKRNVRKDWIEGLVLREIGALLRDEELLEFIIDQTFRYYMDEDTDSTYTDTLRASLQEVETALENLCRAAEAGLFNDTVRARMEELEGQKRQILASIEQSKVNSGLRLTREHIRYFLYQFRDMDLDDAACQKKLIDTFINAVFVYDDKITITFNYSGDGRTITLAEVDAAEEDIAAGEFADGVGTSTMKKLLLSTRTREVFSCFWGPNILKHRKAPLKQGLERSSGSHQPLFFHW